ncbi:hypothetical protein Tco_0624534 [Tanacetum coccineum]|uniref:Uncharacterized protein n=1 Tax=Tanacetum coccineum TaxID=301880 RepID=A0ABQ4WE76_9ASTR
MRIEESLNVTFDESVPEPMSSRLVGDDRINYPVVPNPVRSLSSEANASKPSYPKSDKEARGHLIEQLIARRLSDLDYSNETLPYATIMTTLFEYLKNNHPNDVSRVIKVEEVTPMCPPYTMESIEL